MKLAITADLHGNLPEIPQADALIIAGDVSPLGIDQDLREMAEWLDEEFTPWLKRQPVDEIIGIAGNHDFAAQNSIGSFEALPWTYLKDSYTYLGPYKVWGSPWVPNLPRWAYSFPEKEDPMSGITTWAKIHDNTDILVTHGPPFGYGDWVDGAGPVGSKTLFDRLGQVRPPLHVYGHIHEGAGHRVYAHTSRARYLAGEETAENACTPVHLINASFVDEYYKPRDMVVMVEMEELLEAPFGYGPELVPALNPKLPT